jgi:hypothetical protein
MKPYGILKVNNAFVKYLSFVTELRICELDGKRLRKAKGSHKAGA